MPKSAQVKLWLSLKVLVLASNCEKFDTKCLKAVTTITTKHIISPCHRFSD